MKNNQKLFISKLSNTTYSVNSSIDMRKFNEELLNQNMSIEKYCDLYLTNIAHKKHLRALEKNEFYIYKNIHLSLNTYEKIIVNSHFKCELCGNFYAASKPSFVSHIKRKHKISFYDYFIKSNYTEINPKNEKCSFCD